MKGTCWGLFVQGSPKTFFFLLPSQNEKNTSLAAKGALAHSLHRLSNPKWPPGGPKMAEGVWKGVYPLVLGHSKQLSLNKFFDLSTPSMRKVDDGEEKRT